MKKDLSKTDGKGEHADFTRLRRHKMAELVDKDEKAQDDNAKINDASAF
jgi:hypothetical protein